MSTRTKKWLKNSIRWGIAIFGIWYVISNISWYDRVLVPGNGGWPVALRLAAPADEESAEFKVFDSNGSILTFTRDQIYARVDTARITVNENGQRVKYDPLAQKVLRNMGR